MKPLISLVGFLSLSMSATFAVDRSAIVRVTTYWHEEGQARAACNGSKLRNGFCAVDPKKIPYGSKIVLPEDELIAVDTGPAVISRKAARLCGRTTAERNAIVVDRYFETKAQALAWEKSHPHFMSVRIVAPESQAKTN
jgi:3D (Asp-Asp-Asp) domain-containing protein